MVPLVAFGRRESRLALWYSIPKWEGYTTVRKPWKEELESRHLVEAVGVRWSLQEGFVNSVLTWVASPSSGQGSSAPNILLLPHVPLIAQIPAPLLAGSPMVGKMTDKIWGRKLALRTDGFRFNHLK